MIWQNRLGWRTHQIGNLGAHLNDPKFIFKPDVKDPIADIYLAAYDLSKKFANGAKIFLHLCNSGADIEILQFIAHAFKVEVKGFTANVYVCPQTDNNKGQIDRTFTSTDQCKTRAKGFEHLQPKMTRSPRPWSANIKQLVG